MVREQKAAMLIVLDCTWFIDKISQKHALIMSCGIIYHYKAKTLLLLPYHRPFLFYTLRLFYVQNFI